MCVCVCLCLHPCTYTFYGPNSEFCNVTLSHCASQQSLKYEIYIAVYKNLFIRRKTAASFLERTSANIL